MKKVVSLTAEEGGPGKYQFYIAYKNRGRKERESGTENVFHLLDGWVTPSPVFRNLVGGLLNLVLALSPDRQIGQHQPQNESSHTLSKKNTFGKALNLYIYPLRPTAVYTHTHTHMTLLHQAQSSNILWNIYMRTRHSSVLQVMWWRGCSILIMSLESDVWLSINTKSHLRVWWGDQIVNKSTAAAQHDKIWPLQNSQQAQANKNPCLSL